MLGRGLVGLQIEDEVEDGVAAVQLGGIFQQSRLLPFWQSPWAVSGLLFQASAFAHATACARVRGNGRV